MTDTKTTPLEQARATVEALELEIELACSAGGTTAPIPLGLLKDTQAALIWAVDELVQYQEHLHEAVKLGVRLAVHITDLEDELAERGRGVEAGAQ